MILSDRSIRQELADGRIVIEPLDESCIQPSSVDLHIDRFFRVFRNHTMRVIDVKEDQEELTELVEIPEDDVFILHPGEFVLGSTLERVALPKDIVARLEGKSSLGRLGLLIHSSLPASEPILFDDGSGLRPVPIGEVVAKRLEGRVVGFDPDNLESAYFPVTGWYEGPADRIYEVRLASGRSVRVTAGHNLFTLDRAGGIRKVRTGELAPGVRVAIPRSIPEPAPAHPVLDLRALAPEPALRHLVVEGPTVAEALDDPEVADLLRGAGYRTLRYYRARGALPAAVVRLVPRLWDNLGPQDRVRYRGGRHGVPVRMAIDAELAWLVGLYVAEGYRRPGQVVLSNTDNSILDRVQACLAALRLTVHRRDGVAVTCANSVLSELFDWIGAGGEAATRRIPPMAFGWPNHLLEALLQGMLDGGGSHGGDRRIYWTCSPGLVDDLLLLAPRLGIRASASHRDRAVAGLFQISMPTNEHKVVTSVPLPDELLVDVRHEVGLSQVQAAGRAGYRSVADLNSIERRSGRDAVRFSTLRRLLGCYSEAAAETGREAPALPRLQRLVEGSLAWDTVVEVVDTGRTETIYDIEVRPGGRKIENFVAGGGGVFVSNTAGFVDAGWNGHLTLELSNVANLPITLYPGMKIGQISFLQMTTEADVPYGSKEAGSKYQHQRGPTPSRYFENFGPRR